jgi:hypothetical protein
MGGLKAMEGMVASMNGATQIRAGAIRPEIVVPFPDAGWAPARRPRLYPRTFLQGQPCVL